MKKQIEASFPIFFHHLEEKLSVEQGVMSRLTTTTFPFIKGISQFQEGPRGNSLNDVWIQKNLDLIYSIGQVSKTNYMLSNFEKDIWSS